MRITAIEPSGAVLKEFDLGDNAVLCLRVLVYDKAGEGLVSRGGEELIVPLEQLGLTPPASYS
jgi:hypothetical protein